MDFTEENIPEQDKKKKKKEDAQPELSNKPKPPDPPKKEEEGSKVSIGYFLSNSEVVREYNPYLKKAFEHYCKLKKIHFNATPDWEVLFKKFAMEKIV